MQRVLCARPEMYNRCIIHYIGGHKLAPQDLWLVARCVAFRRQWLLIPWSPTLARRWGWYRQWRAASTALHIAGEFLGLPRPSPSHREPGQARSIDAHWGSRFGRTTCFQGPHALYLVRLQKPERQQSVSRLAAYTPCMCGIITTAVSAGSPIVLHRHFQAPSSCEAWRFMRCTTNSSCMPPAAQINVQVPQPSADMPFISNCLEEHLNTHRPPLPHASQDSSPTQSACMHQAAATPACNQQNHRLTIPGTHATRLAEPCPRRQHTNNITSHMTHATSNAMWLQPP